MNEAVIITVAVSVAGLVHSFLIRTFNVKLKAIQNQMNSMKESIQNQINDIREDVHKDIEDVKNTVYRIEENLKDELNKLEDIINIKVDSRLNKLNNHVVELRERVAKIEAKYNEK